MSTENNNCPILAGDTVDLYAVPVGTNGDHPKDDVFIVAAGDSNLYQIYYEPWANLGALSLCTDSEKCAELLEHIESYTEPCTVSRATNFSISEDSSDACKTASNMATKLYLARQEYIENNLNWEGNDSTQHVSHGFLEIDWDPELLPWGDDTPCDASSCAIASLICDASASMEQEASSYACPIAFSCC